MMPSGDDDKEPITAHVAHVSKDEYERLEAELRAKQDQELQASNVPATNATDVVDGDDEASTENEAESSKNQRRRWIIAIVVALVGVCVVVGVVMGVAVPKKQTQSDASSVTTGAPPTPAFPPIPFPTTTPSASLIELLSSVSQDGGTALQTPLTPQNNAMKWLAGNANLDTYSDEKKIQRYALSTLYYSTKGDTWSNKNNWLDDGDECSWYSSTQWASWSGVSRGSLCSSSGSVVLIDMKGNNLQGTIPQELALLSNSLDGLGLDSNSLTGTIPSGLTLLTQMRWLWSHNNKLTGTVPSGFSSLSKLDWLYLYNNNLTGPFTCPTFTTYCRVSCSNATVSCRSL